MHERRRPRGSHVSATTIDGVIEELDALVSRSRDRASRLGYFAALYRKVTVAVEQAIREGEFDDGERMEQLDVRFANRYLDAVAAREEGRAPTTAWQVPFEAAPRYWPIVVQHLLLGMNAHINLDLGIAAARTAPGAALPELLRDFDRINGILASLVGGVKAELTRIWPLLGLLDRLAGTAEDRIIDFSMERARDSAWRFAEKLAPLPEEAQAPEIARMDELVAVFGRMIWKPPAPLRAVEALIRLGERGSVSRKIHVLS